MSAPSSARSISSSGKWTGDAMNWEDFFKGIQIAPILGAAATYMLTALKKYRDDVKSDVERWQETIIYTIIRESGDLGLPFKDLYSEYKNKALNWEKRDIGKREITEREVNRILVNLISKNAIAEYKSGIYTVVRDLRGMDELIVLIRKEMDRNSSQGSDDYWVQSKKEKSIDKEFLLLITEIPWTYTFDEASKKVSDKLNYSLSEVRFILSKSYDAAKAKMDASNKLGPPEPRFDKAK